MGNKKNKKHHKNNHRHMFQLRKHNRRKRSCEKSVQTEELTAGLGGSRIINLEQLQGYVNSLTIHSANCGGNIIISGEKRHGLASIISTRCSKCNSTINLTSSQKVKGPRGYQRWQCNLAAVWGQMTTGGGHTKLEETMGVLGVPVMSPKSFTSSERDIGEWWQQELEQIMIDAGKEEKRLAEERGDYHEGVPAITVVVDAGWSKRSHRHSYNAKSGVGIIAGQVTGKLLYIGVRNKYCTGCRQGLSQEQHTCYKNWERSSSEMEPDIILEGFKQAEKVHGVRYKRFVGDGDSSVYPTLIDSVPEWGRYIEKIECANHCCKCYRSALEKLVMEKPSYKGRGGLTKRMRCRLTSAARCAIKMRSKEPDKGKAIKLLERDLQNGPYHCFGQHEQCSADFCLSAKERVDSLDSSSTDDAATDDTETDLFMDDNDELACKFT